MAEKPATLPPPPPQWAIDMNDPPSRPTKAVSLPGPPGFSTPKPAIKQVNSSIWRSFVRAITNWQQRQQQQQQATASTPKSSQTDALKLKKAWEIALSPTKQLPMNAIMMYMSGNSLQIFSIMMVFMLFKGPIQGLINTNAAFAKFETETTKTKMLGVKLIYMLMQCLLLGLGIWKVNAMGLLPYVEATVPLCLASTSHWWTAWLV